MSGTTLAQRQYYRKRVKGSMCTKKSAKQCRRIKSCKNTRRSSKRINFCRKRTNTKRRKSLKGGSETPLTDAQKEYFRTVQIKSYNGDTKNIRKDIADKIVNLTLEQVEQCFGSLDIKNLDQLMTTYPDIITDVTYNGFIMNLILKTNNLTAQTRFK